MSTTVLRHVLRHVKRNEIPRCSMSDSSIIATAIAHLLTRVSLQQEDRTLAVEAIKAPLAMGDAQALGHVANSLSGCLKQSSDSTSFQQRDRGVATTRPRVQPDANSQTQLRALLEYVVQLYVALLQRDPSQASQLSMALIASSCASNRIFTEDLTTMFNLSRLAWPLITRGWRCPRCTRVNWEDKNECSRCQLPVPDEVLERRQSCPPIDPLHLSTYLYSMSRCLPAQEQSQRWLLFLCDVEFRPRIYRSSGREYNRQADWEHGGSEGADEPKWKPKDFLPVLTLHRILYAYARWGHRGSRLYPSMEKRFAEEVASISAAQMVNILYSFHTVGYKASHCAKAFMEHLRKDIKLLSSKDVAYLGVSLGNLSVREMEGCYAPNDNIWCDIRDYLCSSVNHFSPRDAEEMFFSLARARVDDDDDLLKMTAIVFFSVEYLKKCSPPKLSKAIYVLTSINARNASADAFDKRLQIALQRSAVLAEAGHLKRFQVQSILRNVEGGHVSLTEHDKTFVEEMRKWA